MKTCIGMKIIEAVPTIRMGDEICREGYRVRYQDGYESFSPKAAFEGACHPIDGMNSDLAIGAMKKGKKCRRTGQSGKNQHIKLASAISYTSPEGAIISANREAIGNRAIALCDTSGVQIGWLAGQADILTDDRRIME